jgi:hypothetical protein
VSFNWALQSRGLEHLNTIHRIRNPFNCADSFLSDFSFHFKISTSFNRRHVKLPNFVKTNKSTEIFWADVKK